ncbi:MAG: hypothetical protein EOP48_25820 [Sphingobacteriales bacterium]|nr:MAG: hypothetical protein EOP48_25820 [Sphingobacteriales bacterium]
MKNGVPLNLQTQYSKPYTCYEVAAFNGDIFVGGGANVVSTTDSFYSNAAYWKNALEVTVDNEFNSGVHGIFAKDGDVYTCGLLRDGNGITQTKKRAVYWKNQERHILSEEESFASAIIVLNSHVYVCGIIGDKAALWIDGTLFYTLKHTSNFLDMKVVQK